MNYETIFELGPEEEVIFTVMMRRAIFGGEIWHEQRLNKGIDRLMTGRRSSSGCCT